MCQRPFPELPPQQLAELQTRFEEIRPTIERHGRIVFRHIKCRHRLADLIAEMIAIGWKWFVKLVLHGKDPRDFLGPSSMEMVAGTAGVSWGWAGALLEVPCRQVRL